MTLVLAQGSLLSPSLALNRVARISSQGGHKTLDLLERGVGRWGAGWHLSPERELGEGGGGMDFVKNRPVG